MFLIFIAITILILISALIFYLIEGYRKNSIDYQRLLEEEKLARLDAESKKKSTEVRTGQLIEKWIPYSAEVGINPQNARFIGDPIDFIVFDEDMITFIEVKTGQASLTKRQRTIRNLIEEGKVSFKELRIK